MTRRNRRAHAAYFTIQWALGAAMVGLLVALHDLAAWRGVGTGIAMMLASGAWYAADVAADTYRKPPLNWGHPAGPPSEQ